MAIFDDVAEFDDPDSPATMTRTFRYGKAIGVGAGTRSSMRAPFKPTGPQGLARVASAPRWASNFLMVGASRSATGHPLFVAGPQIGYTYPGLTLEADISWPGGQARGATAPGFAGNILIGRGQDYAWSLTSAGSDLIDPTSRRSAAARARSTSTRAVPQDGPRRRGRDDGLRPDRLPDDRPRPGHGLREGQGKTVAVSRQRASFGRTSSGSSRSASSRSARCARRRRSGRRWRARRSRSTSATRTIATSRCTRRAAAGARQARRSAAAHQGTGEYEWNGYLAPSKQPYQKNPPTGLLVNWNNRPAPGWGAADDNWQYGSTQRVRMLTDGRRRGRRTTWRR